MQQILNILHVDKVTAKDSNHDHVLGVIVAVDEDMVDKVDMLDMEDTQVSLPLIHLILDLLPRQLLQ